MSTLKSDFVVNCQEVLSNTLFRIAVKITPTPLDDLALEFLRGVVPKE